MEKYINFPGKIIIGYHKRHDNSNIAFITYYKNDGKIAKEKAFNGWRDKDKEPVIFDNTPVTGLKIVGFVGGDAYSRDRLAWAEIEDPRGFSCQIKTENLLAMLKTDDYISDKFQGQYIYGWDGVTLCVININDSIYQNSIQRDNIVQYDPKDCTVGHYYKNKDGYDYVFLGRLTCLNYKNDKHPRDRDIEDGYPVITTKYVFKKLGVNHVYETYSSGKITNKFIRLNGESSDDYIEKEVKDFYQYDHGTPLPLD